MRSSWLSAAAFAVPALLLSGCDPGPRAQNFSSSSAAQPVAAAKGTVLLRLEKIDGVLIEGFQLQVRLEAPQGQLLLSSTWADLVRGLHPKPTLIEHYDSVIRTSVPAGSFVLSTVMHPGMESEQPTCVTRGQVTPGAVTTVTLKFWHRNGCSTVSG
jgi:hypothetical protein